jgi:hypothetical protein
MSTENRLPRLVLDKLRTKVRADLTSGPVFPRNLRKLDKQNVPPQKLQFWNSLIYQK